MKKLIFLTLAFAISLVCQAQQNLSIRAGYNITIDNFTNKNLPDLHGFNLGANYDIMLTDKFSIRPGLYYLMQCQSSEKIGEVGVELAKSLSNNSKVSANSRYHYFNNFIEIPVVAAWQKNNFDFEIGPYIATEFATRHGIEGKKIDSDYGYKKFDFGFKGSFGYNILGKYYIGISYEQGVRDLYKYEDYTNTTHRTQRIGINIGYRF